MESPFSACHNTIEVTPFFYACMYDYCACATVKMSQDGVCGAVSDYARTCAKAGIEIDWIDHVTECQPKCPGETVYKQCNSVCKQTCASLTGLKVDNILYIIKLTIIPIMSS